jgi:hypothetical protein
MHWHRAGNVSSQVGASREAHAPNRFGALRATAPDLPVTALLSTSRNKIRNAIVFVNGEHARFQENISLSRSTEAWRTPSTPPAAHHARD